MGISTKLQPLIIICAALAGLALGYYTAFGDFSAKLIEPSLMVLLFFVFLGVDRKGIGKSFANRKFTVTALIINFLWTPVFAYILGRLLLADSIDLRIGFLMLMVTPCTDWYLVFTGLARGDVALGAMILPLNLLLQILLLPVYLFVFLGSELPFMSISVVISILMVLLVPFAASALLKRIAGKGSGASLTGLKDNGDRLQLVFLCVAIIAMFASESRLMLHNPAILLKMLVPAAAFFTGNAFLAQAVGSRLHFPHAQTVSLTMTTLARNSPLSLAIAVAAFPDRPLIPLALVIGPLLELPVLSVVSNLLLRIGSRPSR